MLRLAPGAARLCGQIDFRIVDHGFIKIGVRGEGLAPSFQAGSFTGACVLLLNYPRGGDTVDLD
jgi:hypothetical protein